VIGNDEELAKGDDPELCGLCQVVASEEEEK
jgi:hypothetical protein